MSSPSKHHFLMSHDFRPASKTMKSLDFRKMEWGRGEGEPCKHFLSSSCPSPVTATRSTHPAQLHTQEIETFFGSTVRRSVAMEAPEGPQWQHTAGRGGPGATAQGGSVPRCPPTLQEARQLRGRHSQASSKAQPRGRQQTPTVPHLPGACTSGHSGHSSSQSARLIHPGLFTKGCSRGAGGSRGTKMEPPFWVVRPTNSPGKTPHLASLGFQSGDPKTWPLHS